MDEPRDELAGLHRFLERLDSGELTLHRNRLDVTKSELGILKREVAELAEIVAGTKRGVRGLYRERNGWGHNQHCARVKYGESQELDVREDRYRDRGYKPSFDELPWKKENTANDV